MIILLFPLFSMFRYKQIKLTNVCIGLTFLAENDLTNEPIKLRRSGMDRFEPTVLLLCFIYKTRGGAVD
jgi:hypothetical protein